MQLDAGQSIRDFGNSSSENVHVPLMKSTFSTKEYDFLGSQAQVWGKSNHEKLEFQAEWFEFQGWWDSFMRKSGILFLTAEISLASNSMNIWHAWKNAFSYFFFFTPYASTWSMDFNVVALFFAVSPGTVYCTCPACSTLEGTYGAELWRFSCIVQRKFLSRAIAT